MVNMRMSDILFLKREARALGPEPEQAREVGTQFCLADIFWKVR